MPHAPWPRYPDLRMAAAERSRRCASPARRSLKVTQPTRAASAHRACAANARAWAVAGGVSLAPFVARVLTRASKRRCLVAAPSAGVHALDRRALARLHCCGGAFGGRTVFSGATDGGVGCGSGTSTAGAVSRGTALGRSTQTSRELQSTWHFLRLIQFLVNDHDLIRVDSSGNGRWLQVQSGECSHSTPDARMRKPLRSENV